MLQNCHTHIPVVLVLLCIQLTAFRCSILFNPLTWEAFRYKFAASDYGTTTRGKNCAFFDCCNHTLSYSTGERNQQGKLPDLADIEHIRHRRFCFKWVFVRNERFASSTWDNQRKNTCIHWGGGLHRCLSFQCISHKPAD